VVDVAGALAELSRLRFSGTGTDVAKADEVDVIAGAVLRDFEEIDDAEEAGLDRQLVSDVLNGDLLDEMDLDFTFFHPVTVADLDMRGLPDSDAAGDVATADALSKPLCENHCKEVHRARSCSQADDEKTMEGVVARRILVKRSSLRRAWGIVAAGRCFL